MHAILWEASREKGFSPSNEIRIRRSFFPRVLCLDTAYQDTSVVPWQHELVWRQKGKGTLLCAHRTKTLQSTITMLKSILNYPLTHGKMGQMCFPSMRASLHGLHFPCIFCIVHLHLKKNVYINYLAFQEETHLLKNESSSSLFQLILG